MIDIQIDELAGKVLEEIENYELGLVGFKIA